MIIMEFLNENTIVAWAIIGAFLFLIIIYIIRLYIIRLFKSIRKSKKEKTKVQKQIIYVNKYLNHDLTSIKNIDKQKFYYEAEKRDFFAKKGSFFLNLIDIKGYLRRRLKKKYPDKAVLIRMEMNNGQYKEFVVKEDEKNGFKHGNKKYIFDLDAKYYVIDSNIWAYDYHESLCMPVQRRIPVNDIKETMEHSNITEVENAVNPVTLERFIKSEIAQGILQGATIGKLFKVILILLIITMIVAGIDFIIDLMESGVLQDLWAKK